ncbi:MULTISPECIES: chitobiase/beta-hexosaminidase C-terminal domain-containing protein [unclassified Butyrivibrio]|uniref:chitobiase/beta-hexosaminidase C-terminal domain-containing protein n=1 Tax=unclassified Butyrivibrio TaxID=2639466 RepID=UPI0003F61522|nr:MULTISPECIES: chitobiase/beta-hexosaminidase C-terminal domain-containing protein [unclassified Butyrivibrio]
MKCPNCGKEIPEGHLYCEACGKEINFVPEFDPEVENRINESLSGVADALKNESIFYTKKLSGMKANKSELRPYVIPAITVIGIIIALLVVVIFMFGGIRESASFEEQAENYYVEGDFDNAITLIDKAIENSADEDPETRANLLYTKYEYQREAGKTDDALLTILTLTDETVFGEDIASNAIDQVVGIYKDREDYEAIYELINNSSVTEIREKYSDFLPEEPLISPNGGDFDEVVYVRITDDSKGDIYYTVNGNDPDENSIKYGDELILEEEGDYNIRAVLINKYGIKSGVSKALFHLENLGPSEPVIMEDSGEYSQATMIVAVCDPDCKIYYTNDGSDPTEASTEYISPISMPIGNSTYKFITVDSEGNVSDVVERNYHLTYTTLISVEQARQSIISILLKLDILLDSTGKVRSEEGHFDYVYGGDIEIEGSGQYYKFVETHVFPDGHTSETGLLYAVNTHDGKVNRLGYDSSGKYTLITISNR